MDDPDFPFVGMVIGQNVGGLWYWCLDQAIVQRVLSARSEAHARASTVFAGYLNHPNPSNPSNPSNPNPITL